MATKNKINPSLLAYQPAERAARVAAFRRAFGAWKNSPGKSMQTLAQIRRGWTRPLSKRKGR